MINFFSDYTTKILCLSIFIGIIQMILPKGKLKQNVLFTCMIVITIVIIEPFVNFLNNDIDISKIYEENTEVYTKIDSNFDAEKYYNEKLRSTYEENLRNDIVDRLKDAGYTINSIECECDEETLEPKSLKLEIETEDGFIQPVRIEVSNNLDKNKVNNEDKINIEKIIADNYGIKRENILIIGS